MYKLLKLVLFFSLFFPSLFSISQVNILFSESFDSIPWKMSNTGVPINSAPLWWQDTVIKNNGNGSATDTVGLHTSSYLSTPFINISGVQNIGLQFDQICYIDLFDELIIEYSFDGVLFTRLPSVIVDTLGNVNQVYTGSSVYITPNFAFSKLSNPIVWAFQDSFKIYTAANSANAWITEKFNLDPVIQRETINRGTPPDSLVIRFGLIDPMNTLPGRQGTTHQIWIDNFFVAASLNVSISENKKLDAETFMVYPNPTEDKVKFVLDENLTSYRYRIFTLKGQLLKEERMDQLEINLQDFENGIYLLEVFSDKKNYKTKIIKN